MKRREFITLLGGAAVWPCVVVAQQPAMPVIGFLHGASPEGYAPMLDGFRSGLAQSGYVEGQNVTIEYRWAEGHYDRLPVLAAELVHRQVAGIVTGGTPAALAAKGATSTIPIVINVGIDPVQFGLIASLNRPGGNVTGLAILTAELAAKRLELLHEVLPTTTVVALLVNPTTPLTEAEMRGARDAARSLGLQLHVLNASTESEIDTAFGTLVDLSAAALVVSVDTFLNNQRAQIVALAARHAVPAIYGVREFATSGGLMSYGNDLADAYRQSGIYATKILKGAKPADLPVQQVVRVEFVINLKSAKTLGLTFPITLLGRADEVIE
ncbi:MAG: ABC transporter substrate-binding protein [Alphaproteobacteria bacterium]|nr:ABC transporter substrate-binding protein [Alphaproteobacteria bacterium]